MFQRLPVGGEGGGGAVPYLVFVNLVGAPFCCQCIMHMFFYPNTIDVWGKFSLSVHKENYFHHCKLLQL